jgi:ferredoxin
MSKASITFLPSGQHVSVDPGTKILVAARQAGLPIRFMCAALRCGTCAVLLGKNIGARISEMSSDEMAMLTRLKLPVDGSVRMACRARVEEGHMEVDLDFQDTYDPANNSDFDEV